MTTLERLFLHYPDWKQLTNSEAKLAWRDWVEDFTGFSAPLLQRAAVAWRNGPSDKRPTPGQLKRMVADDWAKLCADIASLQIALAWWEVDRAALAPYLDAVEIAIDRPTL